MESTVSAELCVALDASECPRRIFAGIASCIASCLNSDNGVPGECLALNQDYPIECQRAAKKYTHVEAIDKPINRGAPGGEWPKSLRDTN